jgi:predicted Zn-dependent protease
VTGQLINLAQTPDELAAVIAHEAAHVQQRHVMQAVWRSFGFGVLLDALVGGGTGAGQQAVLLAGSVSNLRYSREAEAEADAIGQQLLQNEGLSSQGMAPFFERIAAKGEGHDAAVVKELLSDHPDSMRRAQLSRARGRAGEHAFTPAEWAAIKATCVGTPGPLSRLRHLP